MTSPLHDIATLAGHRDRITSIAFAPGRNDLVLSAGRDGAIAVWTIIGEESAEATLVRHDTPIRHAAFWPDDNGVLFTSDDGTTRTIDLETGEETGRFTLVESLRHDATEPAGLIKTVGDSARVAGEIVAAIVPLGGLITAATKQKNAASPVQHAVADAALGRVAAITADHTVALYDLATMDPIRTWSVPADDQSRVTFAARQLVVAGSSKIMLFDETSDKPAFSARPTRSAIRGLVQLDASTIATFDASKMFTFWDAERHTTAGGFRAPRQPLHACACGKGRVLIADSSRRIAVVPVAGHAEPEMHEADAGKIRAIAASDDGSRIAVAGDELKLRVFATPP